jgi:hypothetical protein
MVSDRFIQIEKENNGKWVVKRDDPKKPFKPGDKVIWSLDPKQYPDASAHFQFTDEDLVEDLKTGEAPPDLVAEIGKGRGTLVLRIRKDAFLPLSRRQYAVWICDPTLPLGGWFAVGESLNPPPELILG